MRRIICFVALVAVTACSEPLEFADWTVPVLGGTQFSSLRLLRANPHACDQPRTWRHLGSSATLGVCAIYGDLEEAGAN